jgi:protein-tyrosine phosphatase
LAAFVTVEEMRARFVDVHSQVVPSGDDGAQSLADGARLCDEAAAHGTRILFATPHVSPALPLTVEREAQVRAAYAWVGAKAPLDLRLGWELTPMRALLEEDPSRYELGDTGFALLEVPFAGSADLCVAVAEHVEAAGLRPLIAHPERAEAVLAQPELADELAARGWPLQVNATSLVGYHGPEIEQLGWRLVEDGVASLVASDGPRPSRPARLDAAFARAVEGVGEEAALPLFDGSAIWLAPDSFVAGAAARADLLA